MQTTIVSHSHAEFELDSLWDVRPVQFSVQQDSESTRSYFRVPQMIRADAFKTRCNSSMTDFGAAASMHGVAIVHTRCTSLFSCRLMARTCILVTRNDNVNNAVP